MGGRRWIAGLAVLSLTLGTTASAAPERLGVFVGAGALGSPGLGGGALAAGLRYRTRVPLTFTFDLGYAVESGHSMVEDRWWLLPALAWTLSAGPAQIDFGAGVGLGAASGYASGDAYLAAPFGPTWAFQLVPSVRGHVMAIVPLTSKLVGFARLDAASLLLRGNTLGSRVGNPNPPASDTTWFDLFVGLTFRLL